MSKEAFAKIATKIRELREELHQHDYNYHVLGHPSITDHEFDAKLRELEVLEKDYPQFTDPNSPTARVGGKPVDGFPEVKHAKRMLSLDKTFTASELHAWLQKCQGVCYAESKVDGLALKLTYENGELKQAVTRGDGSVGADVTNNARAISTIPLWLPTPFSGEVVGEVYMSRKSFGAYNAKLIADGDEPMANPRNAAVGTFKSKDPKVVAERKLSFIAYGPHSRDDLIKLGFQIPETLGFLTHQFDLGQVEKMLEVFQAGMQSQTFECDGIVIKVQDLKHREELGEGNKSPNWAIAFKYPPPKVKTKLLDIVLSVGRTGRVVPNAVLETVVVSGTKVSAATLHNEDEVKRLGIAPGDFVYVQKNGEIIPGVVGIAEKKVSGVWYMPRDYVDAYGKHHTITREEGFVAHKLWAPLACEEVVHAQLVHVTGKTCLDWDGLGKEHVRTLVVNGVRTVKDLLQVPAERTGLEGKVLEKFLAQREEVKKRPLWRVFHALAPEGIGSTYCKELSALSRNWRALVALPAWRLEELLGEVKSKVLHSAFAQLSVQFQELEEVGFLLDDDKLAATGAVQTLKGLVFCVTGTLTKGRDEVHAIIESHGGLAKSSCTKATNYLVCGDDPGATKLKAAEKHGVPVIDEDKLFQLING